MPQINCLGPTSAVSASQAKVKSRFSVALGKMRVPRYGVRHARCGHGPPEIKRAPLRRKSFACMQRGIPPTQALASMPQGSPAMLSPTRVHSELPLVSHGSSAGRMNANFCNGMRSLRANSLNVCQPRMADWASPDWASNRTMLQLGASCHLGNVLARSDRVRAQRA